MLRVVIDQWRNYCRILRSLILIRRVFIHNLLYELFIFTHMFLALILLLSLLTDIGSCFPIKLFKLYSLCIIFVYIDVKQNLKSIHTLFFYYYLWILYVDCTCIFFFYLILNLKKMNWVRTHICGFRRMFNTFSSE